MSAAVALLGVVIALAGAVSAVAPQRLFDAMDWTSRTGLWVGAGVRISMGMLLIIAADDSRAPLAFRLIGALGLAVGLVMAVLPTSRWKALVEWAFSRRYLMRVSGLVGIALGAFFVWAA